jgi:hypothetical protein
MARHQCRGCNFDDRAPWNGVLVCPGCGSITAVRAAIGIEETSEAERAAIEAAVAGDGDLAGEER